LKPCGKCLVETKEELLEIYKNTLEFFSFLPEMKLLIDHALYEGSQMKGTSLTIIVVVL